MAGSGFRVVFPLYKAVRCARPPDLSGPKYPSICGDSGGFRHWCLSPRRERVSRCSSPAPPLRSSWPLRPSRASSLRSSLRTSKEAKVQAGAAVKQAKAAESQAAKLRAQAATAQAEAAEHAAEASGRLARIEEARRLEATEPKPTVAHLPNGSLHIIETSRAAFAASTIRSPHRRSSTSISRTCGMSRLRSGCATPSTSRPIPTGESAPYSDSPAASRASALFMWSVTRTILSPRKV